MKSSFKPYQTATRATLAIATGLAVAGCSGWGGDRQSGPEYEMSRQMEDLEVPPDLIAPDTERAYRLPDDPGGRISARDMQLDTTQRQPQAAPAQAGTAPASTVQVLPESAEVQLMRDGSTRWLQVDGDPEELWDRLVAFWDSQNLRLERNEPRIGVIETEWAEDRAGIPLRGTQNLFARALGNVYDATTRDQYRMRAERDNGTTEIYITHRGAEEKAEGDSWRWTMRPSDPELEAEMLNRLLVYLTTGDPGEGGTRVAETLVDRPTELQLTEHDGAPALLLGGEYERVWRQLGTFLDRAGLLVDEQDRQAGIYEVTYRPDMTGERDEGGFFSRLFGRGGDRRENERYQIRLQDRGDGDLLIEARAQEGDRLSDRDAEFVLERIQTQMQR